MKKEFFIVAHNLRSAYNVGAILRTADGMGVSKVYLTGYTPIPYTKEKPYRSVAQKMIAKTALGAENYVLWEKHQDLFKLIKKLKKEKIKIAALENNCRGCVDIKKFKPVFPLVLILGNETEGLDKKILNSSDAVMAIPMRGQKESLNVTVAAGIAMFEILTTDD